MATMADITQGAYYRGDPNLGGGGDVALPGIDMSPWQKLADYSVLREKMVFEDRVKQFHEASKQASDILQIDWSKVPEKWRTEITTELDSMRDFLQKNPNAASRSEAGDKVFFEFQDKTAKLKNLVNAGTQRGIEMGVVEQTIATKSENKYSFDEARKQFTSKLGSIYDPINPFPDYAFKPTDLKAVVTEQARTMVKNNTIETTNYKGLDFSKMAAMVGQIQLDNNIAPDYNIIDRQNKTAEAFNDVIAKGFLQEKNPDGTYKHIRTDKTGKFIGLTDQAKGDPTFGPLLAQVEGYNQEVLNFRNATGGFAATINPADGISPDEFKSLLIWAGTKQEIKEAETYTGAANQWGIAKMQVNAQRDIAAMRTANNQPMGTIDFVSGIVPGTVSASGLGEEATQYLKDVVLKQGNLGGAIELQLGKYTIIKQGNQIILTDPNTKVQTVVDADIMNMSLSADLAKKNPALYRSMSGGQQGQGTQTQTGGATLAERMRNNNNQ